ncbi:MAG: hypothetical protein OXN90_13205 [Gemmatimonadota bacterium]|nr:hypothetical protein [Gemmatimonadota bacterium]
MSDKEGSRFAILRPIAQIIEYYPRCARLVWDEAGLNAILADGVSMFGAVVPAAQGIQEQLLVENGRYAQMFNTQAKQYR